MNRLVYDNMTIEQSEARGVVMSIERGQSNLYWWKLAFNNKAYHQFLFFDHQNLFTPERKKPDLVVVCHDKTKNVRNFLYEYETDMGSIGQHHRTVYKHTAHMEFWLITEIQGLTNGEILTNFGWYFGTIGELRQ